MKEEFKAKGKICIKCGRDNWIERQIGFHRVYQCECGYIFDWVDYITAGRLGFEEKKSPNICPVCGGTGKVPPNFYHPEMDGQWRPSTTIEPQWEICRACGGSGIVTV